MHKILRSTLFSRKTGNGVPLMLASSVLTNAPLAGDSHDPPLPGNWRSWVNKVETEAELNSLRRSVKRGVPFGDDKDHKKVSGTNGTVVMLLSA